MTREVSRRVHATEIGDNNFREESPSEVSEEFDHNIDASATTLLESMTNRNSDICLSSEDYAEISMVSTNVVDRCLATLL